VSKYWDRAFIFADMNAFFAGVEQMDYPELRGKPVGVTNGLRGSCIITCSYEARAQGVKTTTHLKTARELCPELIRKPSRPERYVQVSTRVMAKMQEFTTDIEISSVDEVYLDVTASQRVLGSPSDIAQDVKRAIFEVSGVKASVGVADSKLVAKWAAELDKPNGFTVIQPNTAKERLMNVPVTDICGINKGVANYLAQHGARTCGDVAKLPISVMAQRFGNIGKRLHMICSGYDPEPIIKQVRPPKSIGHGKVIPPNTRSLEVLETYLLHMCFKVATRLRLYGYLSGVYSIGLRTNAGWCGGKYQVIPTNKMMVIYRLCKKMLQERWSRRGVSHVQVTAIELQKEGQADLFVDVNKKSNKLDSAVDAINSRFGELALSPAKLLNRSTMPNVIAPSWRPFGHRETILSGKYNQKTVETRLIPFYGFIS